MIIVGSSVFTSSSHSSITGPTGSTGSTGPAGLGLTGSTGSSITGITLVDRYLITTFSDGSTYSTSTQIYGATGNASYLLGFSNIGTGVSLGYGTTGSGVQSRPTNLQLRPIRFVNTTNATFSVMDGPEYVDINFQINSPGVTLVNSVSTERNLIKFNSSGKLERVSDTFGITLPSDPTNVGVESVGFVNANIFEIIRGGGWTGSTGAIGCTATVLGITCSIDPTFREFDGQMYGSSSRVFVTDFRGSTGTIIINNPPNDNKVYGFDLLLSGALNPQLISNRFSSNIKWSLNRPPCFSFDGITCDMKISFFGLGGTTSWYASAISTSSRCTDNQIFDSNCISPSEFTSGSSTFKELGYVGACCKVDGTCQETYAENCVGFFHGIGTTCGATYDSICDKVGACCVFDTAYRCYDYLSCTDCLALGVSGSVTTQFAGKYTTCFDIDCNILRNNYYIFL